MNFSSLAWLLIDVANTQWILENDLHSHLIVVC